MGDGGSFGAKETASAGGLILAGLAIIRWLASWASPEQRRIDAEQREELRKRIEHLTTELEAADASRAGLQEALDEKQDELRREKDRADERESKLRRRIAELEAHFCDEAPECANRKLPQGNK